MPEISMAHVVGITAAVMLAVLGFVYVTRVVPAMSRRHRFARGVLRRSAIPRELLDGAWTGSDYTGLDRWLLETVRDLDLFSQGRYSHPLAYYSLPPEDESFPLAVAVLDEMATIMMTVIPADERPPPPVLNRLRSSIGRILEGLPKAGIEPSSRPPPLPELPPRLEVSRTALEEHFAPFAERRRWLLGWVQHEGRQWPGRSG